MKNKPSGYEQLLFKWRIRKTYGYAGWAAAPEQLSRMYLFRRIVVIAWIKQINCFARLSSLYGNKWRWQLSCVCFAPLRIQRDGLKQWVPIITCVLIRDRGSFTWLLTWCRRQTRLCQLLSFMASAVWIFAYRANDEALSPFVSCRHSKTKQYTLYPWHKMVYRFILSGSY